MSDVKAGDSTDMTDGQTEQTDELPSTGAGKSGAGKSGTGKPGQSVANSEPAKLMRIGTMIRSLLNEIHHAPLDEAARDLLHDIYLQSVGELAEAMSEPLREEFQRLAQPFSSEVPSEPELRLAQAQLVGWLEGLFQGIQAALAAQREMAEQQLQQMLANPNEDRPDAKSPGVERGGVYL